jgi:CRISPR-associated protein Cas1
MYDLRFDEPLDPNLSIQQIRGKEGVRVRDAYARASKDSGVEWKGRSYNRGDWAAADPVNRALSAGNACLYGVCQAAIVALGYSPALGFIHTGKQLSFVYDVADFYKTRTTIPLAFEVARDKPEHLERETRIRCRDAFVRLKLLEQVVRDIEQVLDVELPAGMDGEDEPDFDGDAARPGALWDPETGEVAGGVQHAPDDEQGEAD